MTLTKEAIAEMQNQLSRKYHNLGSLIERMQCENNLEPVQRVLEDMLNTARSVRG